MHPKDISISGFSYDLPLERIAHYPLAERDAGKLLIYREGRIKEDIYRNISHYIPENALLIFNNTKVVEARILFQKATGAQIELFCLEPPAEYPGIAAAMMQTGKVRWKCLIGGASKWKPGQVLTKTIGSSGERSAQTDDQTSGRVDGTEEAVVLEARYIEKLEGSFLVELSWIPASLTFAELLHQAGLIPLPPYIRRAAEQSDSERYQTIYARHDGSVAAPTAGLHFTGVIFESLETKHIQRDFVTLHVGAGTFMPVKSPTLGQHTMHVEFITVTKTTLLNVLAHIGEPDGKDRNMGVSRQVPGPIIPVGTTSLRTLESLYWLGVKVILHPEILPEDMVVDQWDPYQQTDQQNDQQTNNQTDQQKFNKISPTNALQSLLAWMERQGLEQLLAKTQLLITPGYEWKITKALVTNFHQPESTLLLLIAALIGPDWREVYNYALDNGFRFLSYGDGCLLYPPNSFL
ncbi:S-adenosylmethionine:tRNA ribosyltransferase-isomerase [Flavitalea flava]